MHHWKRKYIERLPNDSNLFPFEAGIDGQAIKKIMPDTQSRSETIILCGCGFRSRSMVFAEEFRDDR